MLIALFYEGSTDKYFWEADNNLWLVTCQPRFERFRNPNHFGSTGSAQSGSGSRPQVQLPFPVLNQRIGACITADQRVWLVGHGLSM
jgi:hypothetical protein